MRVLITSISAYGHLQPLVPLAQALANAGHEVAFVTGPELHPRAAATGLTAFAAGIDPGTGFERLAAMFPDRPYTRLAPAEILDWYLPHLFGETLAPALLADLRPLVQSWQPDVILHDSWEFAGPIAAASAGIPSVSQTLGIRFDDSMIEAIAAAAAPLWRQYGLEPDPTAGLYRHLCLDITPHGLQPDTSTLYRHAIRSLRPVAMPPLPGETLPQWIRQRRERPLVYMTLGTNAGTNSDMAMFRNTIDGLDSLDIDVLISKSGGKNLISRASLPDNVHMEDYLPQSLLLPYCSAVICHGGAGTTLSSLALGLPLLILPQGADQYLIGDLILAANAGLRLLPSEVTPSTMRTSVLALLYEPERWEGARRLQREIAAMPAPAETVPLIEQLVATYH